MKKNSADILRAHSLKMTSARQAILDIFSDKCYPLSAEDIYKKLKKTGLDLVTVYRTLSIFEKSGIVKQVMLSKDTMHYERNVNDHHHIICTKCKKISEFTGCNSKVLISEALKQSRQFASISHHSFDLFGLCVACSNK